MKKQSNQVKRWSGSLHSYTISVLAKEKKYLKVYVYFFNFGKACAWPDEGREAPYLHGDVCYGGGGQVKVLLDQNVEFGGQVPSCTNTVNLAGEQRGDLRPQEKRRRWELTAVVSNPAFVPRFHTTLMNASSFLSFIHYVFMTQQGGNYNGRLFPC